MPTGRFPTDILSRASQAKIIKACLIVLYRSLVYTAYPNSHNVSFRLHRCKPAAKICLYYIQVIPPQRIDNFTVFEMLISGPWPILRQPIQSPR